MLIRPFVDVQSGVQHVVVLTKDGRVFQWGEIYSEDEEKGGVLEPDFVNGNDIEKEQITQIACGDNHTFALTSEGEVYSWGNNENGQLGIGNGINDAGPTKVSGKNGFESPVAMVACGGWTSYALDYEWNVSGSIYCTICQCLFAEWCVLICIFRYWCRRYGAGATFRLKVWDMMQGATRKFH